MSLCSVGLYMNSECNKLTYSRTVGVKYLESFESNELEVIFWRSGLKNLGMIEIVPYWKIGPWLLCGRMYAVLKNLFFNFQS